MTPSPPPLRIAVIGAGIMGLCAAWALSRAGHTVSVFDQGPIPNPAAASVDQHRLIRHAYGAEEGYTRMVDQAYAAWEEVWTELGARLYVPTGTLCLETAGSNGWASSSETVLRRLGVPVRRLARTDLAQQFPLLSADGVDFALFVEAGGVLLAERIATALADHLFDRGVALRAHSAVADLDPERGRLRCANGTSAEADLLVIAAGAWVARLLPELAGRVTPSRQVVVYLEPPPEQHPTWLRQPMLLDIDPDSGFYLVPPVAGTALKIGDHRFSRVGDPDAPRVVEAGEVEAILALGRRRLRDGERYRPVGAKVCFYDVAPEERFILEPVGSRGWVMSGFSGHGFKFGPILGLELAAAIAGQRAVGALARWAAGQPMAAEPPVSSNLSESAR